MQPQHVIPVKLIIAFIYNQNEIFREALELTQDIWGVSDYQSQEYFFDSTQYYEPEMGKPLFRCFNSFQKLIDPSGLADIKLTTNHLENILAVNNKRRINLDSGYLDYDKLVLASAKHNYQKIYLKNGIYADPTLFYRKGRYIAPEWAFPDFKQGLYENDFLQIRHLYKLNVAEIRKPSGG
jgi:hypothetical protein